jgi:hypothetical protein
LLLTVAKSAYSNLGYSPTRSNSSLTDSSLTKETIDSNTRKGIAFYKIMLRSLHRL